MKTIFHISIFISTLVLLASCTGRNQGEQQAKDTVHEHPEQSSHLVTLTDAQVHSIQIAFSPIEKKQLTASLKANGLLKVPNQNRASATALLGGIIHEILVQPGSIVKKGQVIATLSNTSFISMQEEFISISEKVKLAKIEFERQKTLNEGQATALKNLQQAESDFKVLQARKSSLQSQLRLIGIKTDELNSSNIRPVVPVISPVGGTVSRVSVHIGSYADASQSIAEIVDNSQLHLDLFVYEKDLNRLKVGQTIHFTLTNNPGKEYDAGIFAISNTFEPNTNAIAIHAMVKGNKEGLIDGMNITALVSLNDAGVDAVPSGAVVNHEGQDYIFISRGQAEEHKHASDTVHADENSHGHGIVHTFERIPVRKGTTDVGYTEITPLKDIPSDVKVVSNGAFFLLAKMNNQGETHAH